MHTVPQAEELVSFIENSSFYNKIQLTLNDKTTTLWWLNEEQKWTSSELPEDGSITRNEIVQQVEQLEEGTKLIIAGNDPQGVLIYRF